MSEFKFNEEQDLGKAISNISLFSCLNPKQKIYGISQVTGDLAGHKFSKLCGFKMISKSKKNPNQIFFVVYCPKLRGNFVRNDKGLSGWYCWRHNGFNDETVMSRNDMLREFEFNVDKFFQSDYFEKAIPLFIKTVNLALDSVVEDFLTTCTEQQKSDARFYLKCVRDSLLQIGDVIKVNDDGAGLQAKLAYNADKKYTLKEADGRGHELDKLSDLEFFAQDMDYEHDYGANSPYLIFKDEKGNQLKIKDYQVDNGNIVLTMRKL